MSIIIVSFCCREDLLQCLASLYAQPWSVSFEVWVVDNASGDGTPEAVAEWFPQVKLLANSENVGFAAANNQALRQARGQYFLLLNPDTAAQPGLLDGLVDYLDSHPGVAAVGPKVLNTDGSLQVSYSLRRLTPREILRTESYVYARLQRIWKPKATPGYGPEGPQDLMDRNVEALVGACMLVRREVLRTVGLLDESFFLYWEETDWCHRMRDKGWQLSFCPDVSIIHKSKASARTSPTRSNIEYYRGMFKLCRKRHGRLMTTLVKWALMTEFLCLPLLAFLSFLLPLSTRAFLHQLASRRRQTLRILTQV